MRAFRNGNAELALNLAHAAATQCRTGTECFWSARLLEAEVQLSNDRLAEAGSVLARELPPGAQFAALAARRTWLLGELAAYRNQPDLSEDLLKKALQMAASAGASDIAFEAGIDQARSLFVYRHEVEKAEAQLRKLAGQAAAGREPYYEALALNTMGMIRLKGWRFDEAIPWFQGTIAAANRGAAQRLIEAASQNLAICYSQLGSFEEALKSRRHAIELLGAGGLVPYRMNLGWEIGNTYLAQDDAGKAVEAYRQALALASTDTDKAKIYRTLAAAYVRMRDWDLAAQSNNKAISYINDDESRPWAEKNTAAIAAGRGNYQEACELYQKTIDDAKGTPLVLWESHAALASLHANARKYGEANREFEKAIEIIDRNVDLVSTQDYRLTFFSLLIEFYRHYVQALIDQKQFDRALEVADSSRARTLLQRLLLKGRPKKVSARDYQSIARASNSVLLFYWAGSEQSYLWVVTPAKIFPPFKLPPARQLRHWVDQYRGFIETALRDPMSTESEAGRHLYEALIAPAARLIPPNSRVVLIPDDALNWINFETLPVYGSSPEEKPHYWIEDARSVVAPSLSVLTAEDSPSRLPGSLLIIGDPASPDPDFPSLQYASQEIAAIETKFPAAGRKTYTGALARPSAYRESSPGQFALMHFSAHAIANRDSPLDSAIVLSGQSENCKLYARNIIDVPLTANLVTISACRSAGARSYSGEGLVGFAWAFLQAGAHHVIAGLWDVTDSSTPGIMDALYGGIASGMAPPDALRAAKLRVIHSQPGYRRPYYWGPFQIYTRNVQRVKRGG